MLSEAHKAAGLFSFMVLFMVCQSRCWWIQAVQLHFWQRRLQISCLNFNAHQWQFQSKSLMGSSFVVLLSYWVAIFFWVTMSFNMIFECYRWSLMISYWA